MTARHLLTAGWRVGSIARSTRGVSDQGGADESCFVTGDVAEETDVQRCAEETRRRLGDARLLVCNAAVLGPVGRLHETTSEAFRNALDINVLGVVNTIKAYWPQLTRTGDARVIVVSGGGAGGPRPMLRTPAYVPSKVALAGLVEVLAPEFADIGGSIIAVAPGAVIPTDFLKPVADVPAERAGAQLVGESQTQLSAPTEAADGYLRLIDYLSGAQGRLLNGTVLSGKWNTPEQLDAALAKGLGQSTYRLRRIDDDLYGER
jgi:3-oxoacyl-[acyl-carrier protein] reductase